MRTIFIIICALILTATWNSWPKFAKGIFILLAAIIIIAGLAIKNSDDNRPWTLSSATPNVTEIAVFYTRADLESKQPYEPPRLGTAFFVPNPSPVRYIETENGNDLIEIVGGPKDGRRGWVPAFMVERK